MFGHSVSTDAARRPRRLRRLQLHRRRRLNFGLDDRLDVIGLMSSASTADDNDDDEYEQEYEHADAHCNYDYEGCADAAAAAAGGGALQLNGSDERELCRGQ